MAWSILRNVLSPPASSAPQGAAAAEEAPARPAGAYHERPAPPLEQRRPSLDAIGQRDEIVRQRVGAMLDRLEDLKSLESDFADILIPLVSISDELSRASMRIAELESSLGQERQSGAAARQEAADFVVRLTAVGNELSAAVTRADQAEAELEEREQTIDGQRIQLRDRLLQIENFERQLFAEGEQNKALAGENKALRSEAQAVDSALSRSEHDLLEARERLGVLDQDNRRIQSLTEDQASQLLDLGGRHKEIETQLETERQRVRSLESSLAAETAARERADAQYETEAAAHRTERGGLAMKLDAAENRAASTEQLLTQARNQLREKDEAFRVSERTLKEASIARTTAERRIESLQADLARQTERFLDMQRLRTELDSRCDMLGKALAAKDAALEQTAARNAALADRIEQISGQHESVRAELETTNRRLSEDLQNERSERALMQGALEIARESRIALQKQHDALKRAGRGWRDPAELDETSGRAEERSNVHPFSSSGKPA